MPTSASTDRAAQVTNEKAAENLQRLLELTM